MTTIVFSKDRAMQLDAFLCSYRTHVTPLSAVHVLFHSTTEAHQRAYVEVFRLCEFAVPHRQTSFKSDLLRLLPVSGEVIFFVDDQVFVRPWTVCDRPGLSLRLGLHLTRCYPMNAAQDLPSRIHSDDFIRWSWVHGQLDWGYPLSLDGHVFDAEEMLRLISSIEFTSPNTLESALQKFMPMFYKRKGTCYREAKVVNIPWNRVQDECPNRHGLVTADELLELWEAGKQIDLRGIYGVLNESAHQEFPLTLEDRC